MNTRFRKGALFIAITAATPVLAQMPGAAAAKQGATIEATAGVEHTDNAFRNDLFKEDETKSYIDLGLGYSRAGDALAIQAMYNAELANYENDTTEEDTVVQGASSITWRALPNRLHFDVQHERSEQIQDSRNPDIRNNRQLRDIVSAGPTFIARLSPVDDLLLNARYSEVSYDDSGRIGLARNFNSDSERVQGGLSWQHKLSETDVLSATYQYSEAQFDALSVEFQYHQLFGTYAVKLRNSGYTLSLGVNRSERDSGDEQDGFYAQAGWNLDSGGHRLSLVAINQLTDSGIGLGGNSLTGSGYRPLDSNYDVVDVVERTSFNVGYGYDRLCERCSVDVGLGYDEQDFDTQPRDQEQLSGSLSFGYSITPLLKASLSTRYSEIDYAQGALGGRTDERSEYGLFLDWRVSRSLSARFWLSQDERDSDAAFQEYDELYGGVSVKYAFR